MGQRLFRAISSLRLTVVLLALALVLVFWGTLAQVSIGLYRVQNEFFRSFFVYWRVGENGWRLPIFPGGYLVGMLLLLNLFAAHVRYYRPGGRKLGVALIHLGVVMLLVGQLLSDLLTTESVLHLRIGEAKNYSEAARRFELVVVDTSDPTTDRVVAIADTRLARGGEIVHPDLPVTVRVAAYHANSALAEQKQPGFSPVPADSGLGSGWWWQALPPASGSGRRDMPSAVVELESGGESLGTYLVSAFLTQPHTLTYEGRRYELMLRPVRYYKPYWIELLEFRHDRYPGTDIPKNFSSRVRLRQPASGEDREVLIYMNNPLRYGGETYYQSGFDPDDRGTVLQVVRNPSWLTPYFACVVISVGLVWQFTVRLVDFARRQGNK